eukprot:CAMPEP_0173396912 /NCGR_PEP_ID=MMETSP1356-20130122/36857_1 /TAXON_ID=77927 ORGANISM="Hemiselmis virescens, Strain PCC157" /NCGR_SAMPLE_ID=MMETSP1356 /ASSEMBLY_ACC=CAM_ASM_000847 /LENGTH=310 /DNA_ID=CAMNT_0014356043 /DNA_START=1 /DNA_END=933 /DNA_ORIENTATION=+
MGMTAFYPSTGGGADMTDAQKEEMSLATIGKALEMGCNMLDTAWVYTNNEALVGRALKKFGRDKFVVASKMGFGPQGVCGKPDFVRGQCEESLKRLDIECIDLYYMHRMDPNTPIEETMACLLELKKEGKIKYVGLSECTVDEMRRAHKVMPLTAIQMEWSLQTRDLEKDIVPAARELGIGIVAYSPLNRGFLSQTFKSRAEIGEKDFRAMCPRFSEENFDKNAAAVDFVVQMAKSKGCTPAQIALQWVQEQGKDVFPIPGTTKPERVEENIKALCVKLTADELKELGDKVSVTGERYAPPMMTSCFNAR